MSGGGKPPLLVTIDGPAGSGKSTLAAEVAEALGLAFLDSGAMFRAVAMRLGPDAAQLDRAAMRAALQSFSFSLQGVGRQSRLLLNGRPLGAEIRTEEVGRLASSMAVRSEVRAFQKEAQQALGRSVSLVAEGRDMGTAVFPWAAHKFFLEATVAERAARRARQLRAMGLATDEAEIARQISARDKRDREREHAPLKPAAGAVIIDTTELSLEQARAAILAAIKKQAHG